MNAKHIADEIISDYLRKLEREMDVFGSALPENKDRPPHRLVITHVEEYEFGWLYFYNSTEFAETDDFSHAHCGNAPVIVDRTDCKAYSTGTAQPVEQYIAEFLAGIRRPL